MRKFEAKSIFKEIISENTPIFMKMSTPKSKIINKPKHDEEDYLKNFRIKLLKQNIK